MIVINKYLEINHQILENDNNNKRYNYPKRNIK